ncbi:MAG: RNA-binding protein [Thiotrichales bacterium]|nr:RNA-binding protein [Thiotrichales bacterium]
MRLDKWLWCARFYKTRGLAADAIKSGKIRLNGDRPKASKAIKSGDVVIIRKKTCRLTVTVLELPKARLSPAKAMLLYEESDESIEAREEMRRNLKAQSSVYPRTPGRPSKRNRRELMKFRKSRVDIQE